MQDDGLYQMVGGKLHKLVEVVPDSKPKFKVQPIKWFFDGLLCLIVVGGGLYYFQVNPGLINFEQQTIHTTR